jgi:hypothetical protein
MADEKFIELQAFARQLYNYLPTVIRDAAEMRQLPNAEQPEILNAWLSADKVFTEQFIDAMDEYGVKRWEKILAITPRTSDTEEERKQRILLILRMRLPYTVRWLRQWLDQNTGELGYTLEVAQGKGAFYTIYLELHFVQMEQNMPAIMLDMFDLLSWVRPANMVISLFQAAKVHKNTNVYIHTGASSYTYTQIGVPK